MYLGNLVKTVVYYLLIGRMTCPGHRDEFPMVSTLVCMVTYWRKLMMNHDLRLSIIMICQATTTWTLNLESILSLCQNH